MKKRQTVSAFRRELSKNVEKQLEDIDVASVSSPSSNEEGDEEEDDDVVNENVKENVSSKVQEKHQQNKKAAMTGATAVNKPKLTQDAVMNLYANCIKLASENKINAKNTWSLALIDHISDIVKNEKDEDDNTNFQKASCTLEAGVKIYASRVDSFHSETFRMLGGISNASGGNGEDEENLDDPRRGSGDACGRIRRRWEPDSEAKETIDEIIERGHVRKSGKSHNESHGRRRARGSFVQENLVYVRRRWSEWSIVKQLGRA